MVQSLLARDNAVRREGEPAVEAPHASWRSRLAVLIVFGAVYGAVMGTYGDPPGARPLQMAYSAIKVPLMLAASFAVGLPAFFALNTFFGLRDDFPRIVSALVATQVGLTVILALLAPVAALVYASGIGYRPAILFHGLMFATASLTAQAILRRSYQGLILANPRHRLLLRTWLVLYVFVGVQMGWLLRPFVGDPGLPTQFFRDGGWSNAYVVVIEMVWGIVVGPSPRAGG